MKKISEIKNEFTELCNFQALLLAWRLFLSKGEDERDQVSVGPDGKDGDSARKGIDSIVGGGTPDIPATTMEPSSIEALKGLLSTDSISEDRLALTAPQQHLSTDLLCSNQRRIEYFLGYSKSTDKTERCLLAIPELEVSLLFVL